MTSALISAQELYKLVEGGGVKILDATYGQPEAPEGITGAVDFDIDDIAAPDAEQPHTIPAPELFAKRAGMLGIGNDDLVVVYDRSGIYMAASRVWWMFRLFGHDNVKVLDGGLPAWLRAGYPVGPKQAAPAAKKFTARFRPELFKSREQVKANLEARDFIVLDARDPKRYAGAAPEPRPGMAPGHIPGSLNAPFQSLIDPATGGLKPRAELEKILSVGRDKPLACSCGSGVTACVVALGLYETGTPDAAVYGGSWAEWGADAALPKTTGQNP